MFPDTLTCGLSGNPTIPIKKPQSFLMRAPNKCLVRKLAYFGSEEYSIFLPLRSQSLKPTVMIAGLSNVRML